MTQVKKFGLITVFYSPASILGPAQISITTTGTTIKSDDVCEQLTQFAEDMGHAVDYVRQLKKEIEKSIQAP